MAGICISKTFQKNSNSFKINKLKRERQEKYLECEREMEKNKKITKLYSQAAKKKDCVG
jgi:hypothetical protein